jgi:uncharacterized protein
MGMKWRLISSAMMAFILGATSAGAPAQSTQPSTPSAQSAVAQAGKGFVRTSQYIAGRTGRRLAIDVYRPVRDGLPVTERLPVILMATPYHRAAVVNGELQDALTMNPVLAAALAHGYAVAALDTPTHGASFGAIEGSDDMGPEDTLWDLHDAVGWLAEQPWSDGRLGMYGCSYVGVSQLLTASTAPDALKAIVPGGVPIDPVATSRANGVSSTSLRQIDQILRMLDVDRPAPPVDADQDGVLLAQAVAEHRRYYDAGRSVLKDRAARPFRDSLPKSPDMIYPPYVSPFSVGQMRMGGTSVLLFGGWSDPFIESVGPWMREFKKAGVPAQVVIGPWKHCEWYTNKAFDTTGAHLRWYDRWVKGLPNGAEKDPTVRYYVVNAPAGHEWRTATSWPPAAVPKTRLYLAGEPGGKAVVPGAGGTLAQRAESDAGRDAYRVDYEVTTSGINTRYGFTPGTDDMKQVDDRSMTYTGPVLQTAADLLGSPVLTAWVDADAADTDLFAYVEMVDAAGRAHLISDGAIRASNRAMRTPPWDNLGLPWHGSFEADQKPLTPGEPAELEFALNPIAYHIPAGARLRLTLSGFDKGNWDTAVSNPAPTLGIRRGGSMASFLELPLASATKAAVVDAKPKPAAKPKPGG